MAAETPTGTSDGEALSVDQLVRRLERTIAELQVENARLKSQLEDRDGQHPTRRLEEEHPLEAEDKRQMVIVVQGVESIVPREDDYAAAALSEKDSQQRSLTKAISCQGTNISERSTT